MPLYEYVCEQDGTVLELMRPMSQADAPIQDPAGKGRRFVRKISTFAAGGSAAAGGSSRPLPIGGGGCCPCGKNGGGCGQN